MDDLNSDFLSNDFLKNHYLQNRYLKEHYIGKNAISRSPTLRMALALVVGVNYVESFGATFKDIRSGVYYQATNLSDNGLISILSSARATGRFVLLAFTPLEDVSENQQRIKFDSITF